MTIRNDAVRAAKRGLALRGALVLMLAGGVLLTTGSSRALSIFGAWIAREQTPERDAQQLDQLLSRVRGVDAAVCQLIGRALDNRYGGFGYMIHGWETPTEPDDQLLEWLSSASIEARLVPRLRQALSDADGCVRRTAAHLLGRARVTDLSEQIAAELRFPEANTREAAVRALGYFNHRSGFEEARDALRDADGNVRIAAAWTLGMIEDRDAIDPLSQAASSPDARLRRTIAWALGTIEDARAISTLNRLLADADTSVRVQAAHALGQIESAEAVPALVRVLETDTDPRVRRAAAAALGQIER